MKARKPQKKEGEPSSPGPAPYLVKIEGDWTEAIKTALAKKKPPKGWPEQPKPTKR